jgi:hypothetical protein
MIRAALLGAALIGISAIVTFAAPQSASLALSLYFGHTIVAAHALPSALSAQSFAAAGSRWYAEGWLGAATTWLVYRLGGYPGLVAGNCALACLAVFLVELRCRERRLSDAATGLVLVAVIVTSVGVLHAGDTVADLPFAAALLLLMSGFPGRRSWFAIPLTLLWVNVSPDGLIALVLAACALAGTLIATRAAAAVRKDALLLACALVAVTLLTPATVNLLVNYGAYLGFDPSINVAPWEPVRVSAPALLAGLVPLMIFGTWLGLRRAGNAADVLVALGAIVLALMQGRYLGIAALAAAPALGAALDAVTTALPQSCRPAPQRRTFIASIAAIILIATSAGLVSSMRGARALDGGKDPSAAIEKLAGDGRRHHLLCTNPSWCNYALLRGAPSLQVFMDGREVAYPENVRSDSAKIAAGSPLWLHRVKAWNIDTIVASKGTLASLLALLPQWTLVPMPGDLVVFERR